MDIFIHPQVVKDSQQVRQREDKEYDQETVYLFLKEATFILIKSKLSILGFELSNQTKDHDLKADEKNAEHSWEGNVKSLVNRPPIMMHIVFVRIDDNA